MQPTEKTSSPSAFMYWKIVLHHLTLISYASLLCLRYRLGILHATRLFDSINLAYCIVIIHFIRMYNVTAYAFKC